MNDEKTQSERDAAAIAEMIDAAENQPAWMFVAYALRAVTAIKRTWADLNGRINEMRDDRRKTLDILDAAGMWTGADDLIHDRVQHMKQHLDHAQGERDLSNVRAKDAEAELSALKAVLFDAYGQVIFDDIMRSVKDKLNHA